MLSFPFPVSFSFPTSLTLSFSIMFSFPFSLFFSLSFSLSLTMTLLLLLLLFLLLLLSLFGGVLIRCVFTKPELRMRIRAASREGNLFGRGVAQGRASVCVGASL